MRALLLAGALAAGACSSRGGAPAASAASAPVGDERMDWWREARFGMFIHWGLYAIPAGEWEGRKDHGEWIRESAHIPVETYDRFQSRWNPTRFDADAWVSAAKSAGMRYITITSKHHDGFCLFDSKLTDFDAMSTPFRRDALKELADACRRQGIRICWYHSIMDWHHPDYLPRRGWESRPAAGADFDRYVRHLYGQVTELLTNYGDIGVMWFDGEWESTWTHEYGKRLYELCRKLQPDVIVNNRVDVHRDGMAGMSKHPDAAGDFGTPEQEIPARGLPGVDWETCMTMNDHWGFNRADKHYKSTEELIRMLVDIASKGGNFLLNVGPTAEGELPPEALERLKGIGRWMDRNSESIRGTEAGPFPQLLPWGRSTMRRRGAETRLYLHVFEWPKDGTLVVPGLGNAILDASLLADRSVTLRAKSDDGCVRIAVPSAPPDPVCSVVVLDVTGAPVVYEMPRIEAAAEEFVRPLSISIRTEAAGVEIRYSLDGSEPGASSPLAGETVVVSDTTVVKARSFHDRKPVSATAERRFARATPRPAEAPSGTGAGVKREIFEGNWDALPDFEAMAPVSVEEAATLTLPQGAKRERVGHRLSGLLSVPRDDVFLFELLSDDGARLSIDGVRVVDHDGLHPTSAKRGSIALGHGLHRITVEHFNKTGGSSLEVRWAPLGEELRPVGAESLFIR